MKMKNLRSVCFVQCTWLHNAVRFPIQGFGDVETKPKKEKKKRVEAGSDAEGPKEAPPGGGDSSDEGVDNDDNKGS